MIHALRRCPFCGSTAMMFGGGYSRSGRIPAHVECSSRLCLAKTGEAWDTAGAAAIWNNRVEEPNPDILSIIKGMK